LGTRHVVEADAGLPGAADAALAAVLLEDVDAFHPGCRRGRRSCLLPSSFGVFSLGHDGEEAGERAGGGPLLLAVDDVVLAVGVFSNVVSCPPASQPTLGSERQNALSQSLARWGSQSFFCSSLPKSMTALQPIDWWAETMTAVEPQYADALEDAVVRGDAHAEAAVLLGDGHAEHADREELVDDPARDLLVLVDRDAGCSLRR
jgi:hypothetical protein